MNTWGCRLLEWFRYVSASVECSTKSMKLLFSVSFPNPLIMHWTPNNTELPWCSTACSSHLKAIKELQWSWCVNYQLQEISRNRYRMDIIFLFYLHIVLLWVDLIFPERCSNINLWMSIYHFTASTFTPFSWELSCKILFRFVPSTT